MMIKELPTNSRPRERLIEYGAESLSNEELLAIVLNTGYKDSSAKDVAIKILKEIDDLNNISFERLTNIKGIGNAKACKIIATIELGKRINNKIPTLKGLKVHSPKIIYEHYKPILRHEKQEKFIVIYLDNKQKIIKDKELFIGTINESIVHTREIFKYAYEINARSIICIHNHSGGDPYPSLDDIKTTQKISDTGNLLNIPLIDHIIIGNKAYYSLKENHDIRGNHEK